MKKKIVAMMIAGTMALSLSACGGGSSSSDDKSSKSTEQTTKESKDDSSSDESTAKDNTTKETATKDLPDGDYQDTGSGSIIIATAGGTSENGNVPVIYESADTMLDQIELDSTEFDGSKLSFIYIDGMLVSKEQLTDSQVSLDLQDQSLSVGTHLVEVLQYDGDSPDNSYVTYKSASYEVKEK